MPGAWDQQRDVLSVEEQVRRDGGMRPEADEGARRREQPFEEDVRRPGT